MEISHFLKAFWSWVTGKQKLLPKPLIRFRWEICQQCPLMRRSTFRTYCNVCKCTLSKRRHPFQLLSYPDEACKKGYWQKIED